MEINYTDFNCNAEEFETLYGDKWKQCVEALETMPLHLKASDQAGIQGRAIFDPVGTNESIKSALTNVGWAGNVAIPKEYAFLGTDVDFIQDELIIEVQFSNYPFLLNNVLRSEFFYKSKCSIAGSPISAIVIITKAHMFPASNSTLYYEQGVNQLTALASNSVFDVPIRLVGLFEEKGATVPAVWTTYQNARYSRTVREREAGQCVIRPPRTARGRCILERA